MSYLLPSLQLCHGITCQERGCNETTRSVHTFAGIALRADGSGLAAVGALIKEEE